MKISVIGPLPKSTNPSASATIFTWLFVAVRQFESCPDRGLDCCDSYLNLGFTKSTVRLSLTDYNESPLDGNVECGCCSPRLLLAIEISPPTHAITSPSAPPLTWFALTITAAFSGRKHQPVHMDLWPVERAHF